VFISQKSLHKSDGPHSSTIYDASSEPKSKSDHASANANGSASCQLSLSSFC